MLTSLKIIIVTFACLFNWYMVGVDSEFLVSVHFIFLFFLFFLFFSNPAKKSIYFYITNVFKMFLIFFLRKLFTKTSIIINHIFLSIKSFYRKNLFNVRTDIFEKLSIKNYSFSFLLQLFNYNNLNINFFYLTSLWNFYFMTNWKNLFYSSLFFPLYKKSSKK